MPVTSASIAADPIAWFVFASAVHASSRSPAVDRPTLEGLFRDHSEDVHRIVSRLLGPGASPADVEDLVQQVFVAVHDALPRFRGDAKPTTWLYGIASRTVLGHLRGRRRHRRMVETLEAIQEVAPSESTHPENEAAQRQALTRVWRALMSIKPKKRVVFLLFEVEGLTGREIADALHIKEATVHTRLYHARRELDARLASMEAAS
jgi:RNA polymerase sigma-70 factor (ECF subfamily)